MKTRPAQAIIDLGLHENQVLLVTLYVLAMLSLLTGLTVLSVALWRNQPTDSRCRRNRDRPVSPAGHFVQKLRRENVMLRLLQIGLDDAQTTSGAGDKIRVAFEQQLHQEAERNEKIATGE